MTPHAFRAALKSLGLSQREAARRLPVNERTVRRWAKDGAPDDMPERLRALRIEKRIGK